MPITKNNKKTKKAKTTERRKKSQIKKINKAKTYSKPVLLQNIQNISFHWDDLGIFNQNLTLPYIIHYKIVLFYSAFEFQDWAFDKSCEEFAFISNKFSVLTAVSTWKDLNPFGNWKCLNPELNNAALQPYTKR